MITTIFFLTLIYPFYRIIFINIINRITLFVISCFIIKINNIHN